MGARLLRKWIVLPLKDKTPIEERLNTVSYFLENEVLLDELTNHLRQIGDLERLISKVAVRRVNPREAHHGPGLWRTDRTLAGSIPSGCNSWLNVSTPTSPDVERACATIALCSTATSGTSATTANWGCSAS